MNTKPLLTGITLALLSGCATTLPTIHDVDLNNLEDNQSVLIFSTGAFEACKFNVAQVVVKKEENKPSLFDSIGVYQLNNGYIDSFFESEYGLVYSTILEPGTYDFWLSSTNGFITYEEPLITKPFTLNPKEIKYIGEIYGDRCGGNGDITVTINDQKERDLQFIQEKVEGIDLSKVVIEQIKPTMRENKANK